MKVIRKIGGIIIIIFLAWPIMFGLIWAVGATQAVLSSDFMVELPQQIMEEVPDLIDEIMVTVKEEEGIVSDNEKEWIKTISSTGVSIKQLLIDAKVLGWAKNELIESLRAVNEILQGERKADQVILNMRPLKEALTGDVIERFFLQVVALLPPCDEDSKAKWEYYLSKKDYHLDYLPHCQPPQEMIAQVWQTIKQDINHDIPDEVNWGTEIRHVPFGMNIAKIVISLSYLFFIIPIAFIVIGSLVGATSRPGFFRWCGLATLGAGFFPWAMASFFKNFIFKFTQLAPFYYTEGISSRLEGVVWEKMENIFYIIVNHVLSPVAKISGIVCVAGIIIFAFSFIISDRQKKTEIPAPVPPVTQ